MISPNSVSIAEASYSFHEAGHRHQYISQIPSIGTQEPPEYVTKAAYKTKILANNKNMASS